MCKSSFSLKLGLTIDAIYFITGLVICIFIFPFVFTTFGYFLMGVIGFISSGAFYIINRKVLKILKKNQKFKEYWCGLSWVVPLTLWIIAPYISRPMRHILFFVGFGYLIASLIAKISMGKRCSQKMKRKNNLL